MVKPSKKSATIAATKPLNPEAEERHRLKRLAISNHQLSATAATGFAPLAPSKTVVKHHGKDILKKSQRKNRFLFSFPGLIAAVEGGRIGELTDLGSKNPKLYLEFPQGRMKLLGTIVYSKNRYLTLQFSKGGKNVICDDYFDAMIVFSDAFWIGRKDDNPEEARLDFPKELYKGKHAVCDFQGGAGATAMKGHNTNEVIKRPAEQETPSDLEPESPEKVDKLDSKLDITPARHSERTAGKKFKFAEVSSGDDSANSGSESSGGEEAEDITDRSCARNQGVDEPDGPVRTSFAGKQQSRPTSVMEIPRSTTSDSKTGSHKGHGPLKQATISTLFKKAVNKMGPGDTNEASSETLQKTSLQKTKKTKAGESSMKKNLSSKKIAGSRSSTRMKHDDDEDDEDDDIEDFSSSSQEINGSDDDWAE